MNARDEFTEPMSRWSFWLGGVVLVVAMILCAILVGRQTEANRIRRDKQLAKTLAFSSSPTSLVETKSQREGTQKGLRRLGELYLRYLENGRPPQGPEDLLRVERDDDKDVGYLTSYRSSDPFVIVWGVDLEHLPAGGEKMLLAWEPTEDQDGHRYVLLADGRTTVYMLTEDFNEMPKAKPIAKTASPPERGNP